MYIMPEQNFIESLTEELWIVTLMTQTSRFIPLDDLILMIVQGQLSLCTSIVS